MNSAFEAINGAFTLPDIYTDKNGLNSSLCLCLCSVNASTQFYTTCFIGLGVGQCEHTIKV